MQRFLATFCILFSCTCFLYAQQVLVSIHAKQETLRSVIDQLSAENRLQFAYSSNQVNIEQRISADLNNVPLETALKTILSPLGISYTINGSMIILYKNTAQRYTISGRIREKGTGELLIGVIVNTDPPKAGSISNSYGFYSITLPADTYNIQFNYLGFKPLNKKIMVSGSITMDTELEPVSNLEEVVVTSSAAEKEQHLNVIHVPLKEIADIPVMLGEKDIVKYISLMPGVQKGNEGNSYMYVRGGGPDQNLILIDDAVIYNAYHFLGLSSLFSGNELRSAELIKGGFSSKYGGRLSSVLNMSMKDGNREKLSGEATIGLISSRVLLEAPIVKNKSSFMLSVRRSYLNEMSRLVIKNEENRLDYYYYDIHAKISTDIGIKDRLMLSGYIGQDLFNNQTDPHLSSDDDGIKWGNKATTLRWNHQYSGKLFSNTSLIYSNYNTQVSFGTYEPGTKGISSSAVRSSINDYSIKSDFDYIPGGYHHLKWGAGYTYHYFNPSTSFKNGLLSTIQKSSNPYHANEAFAYAESQLQLTPEWKIVPGIRFSYFSTDISYIRAEPRLSTTYSFKRNWNIQTSYSLMNQYVHLISSFNGLGFPSDVWISSDQQIRPQRAHLITAGISKEKIRNSSFSFSMEAYYKIIQDITTLKDGASFFQLLPVFSEQAMVTRWSDLLTQGTCYSYGSEFIIRKEGSRFTGWISYSISKTDMKFDAVNHGNKYPATYDRRHDLGVHLTYKTSKHFKFSANWIYGSGYAITLPVGEFYPVQQNPFQGSFQAGSLYDYESKNSFRMKAYHRTDISVQYRHLLTAKISSTIELSLYNVYNRANPFYYRITNANDNDENSKRVLKQYSLFPIMPSVSWSLKF